MSDRPTHRGGGGGGRGGPRGGSGSARGGARGGGASGGGGERERPKKENILDLSKYMDKQIAVKFNGGREGAHIHSYIHTFTHTSFATGSCANRSAVKGTLKGYDALTNLVLDDAQETVRDDQGNESTRSLGLVVARGTLLVLLSPVDGSEEIANPFIQPDDE
ncbi:U6 snRNA-associated Sm-like protein LSm7 [Geosmithia morbida]|uniref:U6 snRNA-associated Sm-like protein LSm7 n=1 Tax=Geosmithia morbida TaxID=1094350 RepID=A0A9P4YRV9_9HYPO|nr:U6 snRNA-associated Sm-like protein LSm7 [Geosmithia morbida]KAF4119879.1 U6 snRNA-associated Sm-like protein LSm7 [Geosmithia morbida]